MLVLEDFEGPDEAGMPSGWKRRAFGDDPEEPGRPYRVLEENGNRFLRAEDRGENVMIYREIRWDVSRYPYLGWRWRIRAVPEGADARYEETADNAAGVYLTYRRRLGLVPVTVKFVWSEGLESGDAFRRPGIGMPWTVIAGSGAAAPTEWRYVVVDVAKVYEETFGGSAPREPLGVGLLTDANSTGGYAAADYDDIRAYRSVEAAGSEALGSLRVLAPER